MGVQSPAILLSGSVSSLTPDQAALLGIAHILMKPVTPPDLFGAAKQVLERTPART
jgi:hypothetical protein